jgi:hypothetical protein
MAYYKVRIEVWCDWNPAESDLGCGFESRVTRQLRRFSWRFPRQRVDLWRAYVSQHQRIIIGC